MKAPEKIWINSPQDLPCSSVDSNSIEYVRKDAFIEKAISWLKENVTNNPECNRIISKKRVITMGELIEDFRKYMKGE